jgi:hypothetical protein
MTLACELDPLSLFVHGLKALGLFMLGRSTAGERTARRALDLQTDYMLALWARGVSLCSLGRAEEAIEPSEPSRSLALRCSLAYWEWPSHGPAGQRRPPVC